MSEARFDEQRRLHQGPEIDAGLLEAAAKEAGCASSDALGPYPAIGKLALAKYMTALGIAPEQPQGAPVR